MERAEEEVYTALLKRSVVGLVGDSVKSIQGTDLYDRMGDQADRHGVFMLTWPAFVDLVRGVTDLGIEVDWTEVGPVQ